jgi:YD repeat-containing protein
LLGRVRVWIGLVLIWPCAVLALGHRYDAAGRLVWSVQPGGQATHHDYDAAGNLVSVTTVLPAQDSDGDGLPDTWEIRHSASATGREAQEDSDGDGLIDLQEFAFARLPDRPDGANLTPLSIETTQQGSQLTLRYLRPTQGSAVLDYVAEVSSDLKTWSSSAADVETLAPVAQGGGTELVTVRAKAALGATTRLFLRVRLVKR